VSGDADQMHPPTLQLDHEQNVEPGQADRFDGQEVAGEHAGGLGP
jgi:hypothetical protein